MAAADAANLPPAGAGRAARAESRSQKACKLQGKASEHDVVVASQLAYVLTGGDCSPLDELTEQDILDLEREASSSLCGMEKTQERMAALLTTGKPLRN